MIPFKHFILPKIHCDIGEPPKKIEEKIDVASDIEHAETEHGIDANQLYDLVQQKKQWLPTQVEPKTPWYAHHATPVDVGVLRNSELDRMHDKLVNHYNNWHESHVDVLKNYTAGAMRNVNRNILNDANTDYEKAHIPHMDEALRVHRTPHAMTVWSGIDISHSHDVLYSEKVRHPAYLSTSISGSLASSFAHEETFNNDYTNHYRHILKIHVPEGHPGAYIEHITRVPGEHEFIMPRDTVLHIDHSKREVITRNQTYSLGGSVSKTHIFIHHATVVTE